MIWTKWTHLRCNCKTRSTWIEYIQTKCLYMETYFTVEMCRNFKKKNKLWWQTFSHVTSICENKTIETTKKKKTHQIRKLSHSQTHTHTHINTLSVCGFSRSKPTTTTPSKTNDVFFCPLLYYLNISNELTYLTARGDDFLLS